ncbi:MAG TPA: pyridoxal-phosphate dependent enzyme [Ignavibacteriaceae bacterium]|nr:pyridoxal-phosphate dependent enzyme [Ignavibacteriaceae bacterium]
MKKIFLGNLPTPFQQIDFNNKKFLIKRDDLTGVELSGNKVRKLEYILYQAKQEKSDYVFTCGGDQSNHARATVIAASKLGMKTKLFLWGTDRAKPDGNLFLCKFFGAEIRYLNYNEYQYVNQIMFDEKKRFAKRKLNVHVIPEGGSTIIGINGYFEFVNELKSQVNLKKINGILAAAGTGGTAAGILAGMAAAKINTKVFAVNVLYPKEIIKEKILLLAEAFCRGNKINLNINSDNLVILDGYSGEGYKNISDDKLKLIRKFAQHSGILLDPAYTGKSFYAFNESILNNDKSPKVIFLHTGGIFGAFNKRRKYLSS